MPRPRSTARLFPSLAAASGATKVPVAILKAWKAQGCPAFMGSGRVDEKLLRDWISEHKDEVEKYDPDSLPLKEQKTREEVRKLRLANDQKEGKLILRTVVADCIGQTIYGVKAILYKLENEYPAQIEGLDVHQIREKSGKVVDDAMREVQKLAQIWEGK